MIEIYPNGTVITTNIGAIEAIITAIVIRGSEPAYEISYFTMGEYRICTLTEHEFTTPAEKVSVGFKTEKKVEK